MINRSAADPDAITAWFSLSARSRVEGSNTFISLTISISFSGSSDASRKTSTRDRISESDRIDSPGTSIRLMNSEAIATRSAGARINTEFCRTLATIAISTSSSGGLPLPCCCCCCCIRCICCICWGVIGVSSFSSTPRNCSNKRFASSAGMYRSLNSGANASRLAVSRSWASNSET